MDTIILPAMTYGAETWALAKHREKKLAVAQQLGGSKFGSGRMACCEA